MGVIRVSASELRAKAEELQGFNANYKTNTSDLEASEQNLMTMWDGDAKEAFHQAFMRDKVQMDNFSMLIEKYVATLQTIAAKYEQAENTNINTANTRTYN